MQREQPIRVIPPIHQPGSGGLRLSLTSLTKWALKLGLAMMQPRECRYILASPPFSKSQVVRDRRSGTRRSFLIRDEFDYGVLEQIYGNEDYRLDRLARAADVFGAYERLIEQGRTPLIVDCGANIGISSRYFADLFPRARIVAIEPNRENYLQALKNCADVNVDFRHAAIASECKRGTLVDPGLGGWGFRVTDDADGALDMVSVNSLLAEEGLRDCTPFIVKIDIEGFEEELFSNNVEWVADFPLLIIELHDWLFPAGRTSHNFLRTIGPLDRDFVFVGENVFSIAN